MGKEQIPKQAPRPVVGSIRVIIMVVVGDNDEVITCCLFLQLEFEIFEDTACSFHCCDPGT